MRSTFLYGIFVVFMVWLIYFNEFKLGGLGHFLPMSEKMASMSLDILLVPLLASVSVFYAGVVVNRALEGPLAELLVGSLYAGGFATFFALFLILNPGEMVNQAGILLSAAFAVLLAYNAIATVSRLRRNPALRAAAISATIYLEGQIIFRVITLLIKSSSSTTPPELISAVGEFVNLGVSIAAVFTLMAVFKTSGNPYLSALGGIASNYLFSVSLSLIGALYYGFFLGGLSSFAPSISNLSPYVEWTGICVFAALIFTVMRRGMQGSIIVEDRLGQWKKHLQDVTTYKGDRFVGFTEIIDEFVEKGDKQRLLIRLTLFLHENHVADDEISRLLAELIGYEDQKKPTISRSGRAVVIDDENMDRRLKVLQRTITRIVPSGVQGVSASLGARTNTEQAGVASG
jgi:hypothetical protein